MIKLHITSIGDIAWISVETGYTIVTRSLTTKEFKARKEHNQAMLEISSTLTYSKYEDINNCAIVKLIWDTLATIYGGYTNVLRGKVESLRGKFDTKMLEMKLLHNIVEELNMLLMQLEELMKK